MSALNELVSQIEDPTLRARIEAEVERLAKQKKFGLVFEEHLPECTPLYDIPVKRGSKVALKTGPVNDIYTVLKLEEGKATCLKQDKSATVECAAEDLVSVAEFGEPIYPYLKPVDSVCNAPDSDLWHTLIEADNYHALQLLEYLYAGKVDCIYIDPPYNTGARDWKYNNDYVDSNDQYRHSKWLSMMQKRLKIAKKLLNPRDSVLIITIDEKEYLHLGCLLEDMFPEAGIQMITSVINPSGSSRQQYFSRSDEYIFFVFFGDSKVVKNENDMLHQVEKRTARWDGLIRRGANGRRSARPNLFYPLFFNTVDGKFNSVGEPLPIDVDRNTVIPPYGCFSVFPLSENGDEATWGLQPATFVEKLKKGYVRFGVWKPGDTSRTVSHLQEGMMKAVENGEIDILGKNDDGSLILGESRKPVTPLTTWVQQSHSAGDFGSSLLKRIFPSLRFNFPKSLYAVHDALRFFVSNKPNALVVDFFAGSGTTLHAVNLLNAEDKGHRRCILVTNNEVSDEEAKVMSRQGIKPGDKKWEDLGIARFVTWPRTVCSIEGHDINGDPLKGNYLGSDMPMADGFKANAAFFKLGFLDKNAVALGRQFKEMLPTLWMKAGAVGKCPVIGDATPDMLILPENRFAVLVDEKKYMEFIEHMDKHPEIETVYIVTDSESGYQDMISGLNVKETYQLYRDYLDNFRINSGRR